MKTLVLSMKLNNLKIFILLITLANFSCKKNQKSELKNEKSNITSKRAPDIIFASNDDSITFFLFIKSYAKENELVLKNNTFKADKNGTFQIPYSSDKFPFINGSKQFTGFKSTNVKSEIDPSLQRAGLNLIAVNPPLTQEPITPGGGGGISWNVRNNGLYMGKTDMGTYFYPYLSFYTYKDPITKEWSTYWEQVGSGTGAIKYENIWTRNSNGYTSSFGYATWSVTGKVGAGFGGITFGDFPVSESHIYSIFIQIDSQGNRIVKIERRN